MKLAIIGGRDFWDYKLLCSELKPYQNKITQIISGGAPGADTLGAKFSRLVLKKEPKIFEAKWDDLTLKPLLIKRNKKGELFNALAGFNRNTLIIKNCDAVIAFWDGKSPGTKDSLDKANKFNKPKKIIIYE